MVIIIIKALKYMCCLIAVSISFKLVCNFSPSAMGIFVAIIANPYTVQVDFYNF